MVSRTRFEGDIMGIDVDEKMTDAVGVLYPLLGSEWTRAYSALQVLEIFCVGRSVDLAPAFCVNFRRSTPHLTNFCTFVTLKYALGCDWMKLA